MTTGHEMRFVREVMAWDMSLADLVRRARVTAEEWRDMEADRVPIPEGSWARLMNLVSRWNTEQRSRSPFN